MAVKTDRQTDRERERESGMLRCHKCMLSLSDIKRTGLKQASKDEDKDRN